MDKNSSILIVDDDISTLVIIKGLLKVLGYDNITSVLDATSALELCSTKQFDIIITDIVMPNMDGFQFIDQLKTKPIIIIVSGYDIGEEKSKINYFIPKPISKRQFDKVIREIEKNEKEN
jgi:CheY-like chemotaxis protein